MFTGLKIVKQNFWSLRSTIGIQSCTIDFFFTALALKLTTVAVCIINGGHTFLLQRPSWLSYTNFLKFRFCKVNSCVMHLRDDWRDISLKFCAQNYQEFFGWQTFRRKQTSRTEGQSLKKVAKNYFQKWAHFFKSTDNILLEFYLIFLRFLWSWFPLAM